MCGIAGYFDMRGSGKTESEYIVPMLDAIRHRGPDGRLIMTMKDTVFGFNRLSFIDLTGGMQPIKNEDETIMMMCNGEIFNYQELKAGLLAKGHRFRTGVDCEVILHLYEEYGTDFADKLNGQFAIALFDSKEETLLLVRDHVGVAPLFYTVAGDRVVFASEIKAILEYPGVERKLNMKAVDQLMNFPGVVSPNTFFRGIWSLRAGHMLRIRKNREIEDIEYWDMLYPQEENEDLGEAYYVEQFRELFRNAVSRRLIADVPIGFYISGGLDSSLVACFIGKYLLNSTYSFSAEIGSGDLDESRFQKIVRDSVGSEHYVTKVAEEEIWNDLYNVVYYAESAVKESYDVAAYRLSALVRTSPAKAVLTGQGSDEFFCGYVGYMLDLFRTMQKGKMSAEELACNERLWGDPYFRYERIHPEIRKIHDRLLAPDLRAAHESFSATAESPVDVAKLRGLSSQKRRSYVDFKLRLSDHLLGEHGDRMIFSHSVEGRHPFLDREILDFVAKLPDKYKLNGTNEKYILKKAGKGIVPDEILKRKKFPFQAPGMSAMVKKKPARGAAAQEFLSEPMLKKYGVFDPAYVQELQRLYAQDNFQLMGAYEIDYLLIVMTTMMLCERYGLSL